MIKKSFEKSFQCIHCKLLVLTSKFIATYHHNHCPYCLWSKHVDLKKSGDRKSLCKAPMEPIGLSFKNEGVDKYGHLRQGELMLVHRCINPKCLKISINRIAADDLSKAILKVFNQSLVLPNYLKKQLKLKGIKLLSEEDRDQLNIQLFGK